MKKFNVIYIIILTFLLLSCSQEKRWNEETKPVKLEFKLVKDSSDGKKLILENEVLINNDDIEDAYVIIDFMGKPKVSLQMTSAGTKKFKTITEQNVNRKIAILLDNNIISTPTVKYPIPEGRAVINPMKSKQQARDVMAGILKYKEEPPQSAKKSNPSKNIVTQKKGERHIAAIKRIVGKQLGIPAESIVVNAPLDKQKVAGDELDVVEIIMSLEESLEIEITDQDFAKATGSAAANGSQSKVSVAILNQLVNQAFSRKKLKNKKTFPNKPDTGKDK